MLASQSRKSSAAKATSVTDEFAVVHKLRRVLSGLDSHQAIDLLMSQLRKTKTNYEFLVQVSKTTPASMDSD